MRRVPKTGSAVARYPGAYHTGITHLSGKEHTGGRAGGTLSPPPAGGCTVKTLSLPGPFPTLKGPLTGRRRHASMSALTAGNGPSPGERKNRTPVSLVSPGKQGYETLRTYRRLLRPRGSASGAALCPLPPSVGRLPDLLLYGILTRPARNSPVIVVRCSSRSAEHHASRRGGGHPQTTPPPRPLLPPPGGAGGIGGAAGPFRSGSRVSRDGRVFWVYQVIPDKYFPEKGSPGPIQSVGV